MVDVMDASSLQRFERYCRCVPGPSARPAPAVRLWLCARGCAHSAVRSQLCARGCSLSAVRRGFALAVIASWLCARSCALAHGLHRPLTRVAVLGTSPQSALQLTRSRGASHGRRGAHAALIIRRIHSAVPVRTRQLAASVRVSAACSHPSYLHLKWARMLSACT